MPAALRLGGDEDGVPAAGPAQRGDGIFDLRVHLRDACVVRHGDRALLRQESLRRAAANLVGGLGIDAAGGRQGIGAATEYEGRGKEDQAVGADVAGGSVADAIGGGERRCPLCGRMPLVSSPKRRCAVPSDSISTTKCVSVGAGAEQVGRGVQVGVDPFRVLVRVTTGIA